MISIEGLRRLTDALARLDLEAAEKESLSAAAAQIESAVKQALSHRPGEDHSAPWLRTGALRDSISHAAGAREAAIGSNSPIAVYQEMGTRSAPPRPFLAPTAARCGEDAARTVGDAVARVLSGSLE